MSYVHIEAHVSYVHIDKDIPFRILVDIETTSLNCRKPYFEKVCRDLLFKAPNSVF